MCELNWLFYHYIGCNQNVSTKLLKKENEK